jgi:uncharacterized phage infection (PIP) family protein YhgE
VKKPSVVPTPVPEALLTAEDVTEATQAYVDQVRRAVQVKLDEVRSQYEARLKDLTDQWERETNGMKQRIRQLMSTVDTLLADYQQLAERQSEVESEVIRLEEERAQENSPEPETVASVAQESGELLPAVPLTAEPQVDLAESEQKLPDDGWTEASVNWYR